MAGFERPLTVALAGGLLAAICVVSLIAQLGPPGAGGAAGTVIGGVVSVLVAVLVSWNFFHFALAIPIEVRIDEEGVVRFRSRLRTVTIPACDITSITTGAWFDPNRFQAVVRHKGGKLTLVNQFAGFRDFLAMLRELNPAVEIKGF